MAQPGDVQRKSQERGGGRVFFFFFSFFLRPFAVSPHRHYYQKEFKPPTRTRLRLMKPFVVTSVSATVEEKRKKREPYPGQVLSRANATNDWINGSMNGPSDQCVDQ